LQWRVAGVVATLLVLVGCAALPTQPIPPNGSSSLGGRTAVSSSYTPSPGDSVTDPVLPALQPIGTVTDSLGVGEIVPVVGDKGGVINMWGMTVKIPANALAGDATVTMTLVNPDKHECSLEINPPSMNHFSQPVTLEFDMSDATDLRGMSVYWWDPANLVWVPVSSTIDEGKKTVSADLQHFSRYKVDSELMGKAGW